MSALVEDEIGGISIRDAVRSDAEVVYFVQAERGGPIKIGTTSQGGVESRIRGLQTGNPEKLVARRVVAGGRKLEHFLHQRFSEFRLSGEWFGLSDELVHLSHAERDDARTEGHTWDIHETIREQAYAEGESAGYVKGQKANALDLLRRAGRQGLIRHSDLQELGFC